MLLVCATFPLLWVGGLVTTTNSGMAVPDWPTTYGYNPFLYPLQTWFNGPRDIFYEHSHRLLGALIGMVTIRFGCDDLVLLSGGDGCFGHGRGALALVIVQGVLGGMRVTLDERTLAQVHGCVGPLFFALAVATCDVHFGMVDKCGRRGPIDMPAACSDWRSPRLAIAYLQLVLGTFVRHVSADTRSASFGFSRFFICSWPRC